MWKDEKLFRVIDENCWCPRARIKEMDDTGILVHRLRTTSCRVIAAFLLEKLKVCTS